nr:hypothetical protein Q903MT_gene3501 [Picea sitchensis]
MMNPFLFRLTCVMFLLSPQIHMHLQTFYRFVLQRRTFKVQLRSGLTIGPGRNSSFLLTLCSLTHPKNLRTSGAGTSSQSTLEHPSGEKESAHQSFQLQNPGRQSIHTVSQNNL